MRASEDCDFTNCLIKVFPLDWAHRKKEKSRNEPQLGIWSWASLHAFEMLIAHYGAVDNMVFITLT